MQNKPIPSYLCNPLGATICHHAMPPCHQCYAQYHPKKNPRKQTHFPQTPNNATLWIQNLKTTHKNTAKTKQNKQIKITDTQMKKAHKFKKQFFRTTHWSGQNRNLLWDLRKGSERVKLGEMNANWDENWKRHQNVQLKENPSFLLFCFICNYWENLQFFFLSLYVFVNCDLFLVCNVDLRDCREFFASSSTRLEWKY